MTSLHRSLVVVAAAIAGISGCFAMTPSKPVATPGDLERLGTRSYRDRSPDDVTKAAVTALKLLGYDVVTTDPRIRTAPKPVATTSYGTARGAGGVAHGSAQTFTEEVAWDIDVKAEGQAVFLRAVPRAAVNGVPMEQVYIDWAERTFAELMKEIDASMPAK
jgi:hypothetical protein